MALTIREKISARILAIVNTVSGVTAVRPKRVHWVDEVTKSLTAIVRQTDLRVIHEDADPTGGTLICEQDYEITLAVVESDTATTTYETEANRVMADLIEALAGDIDASDNADYEGLRIVGTSSVSEEIRLARQIGGETLLITVTFTTGRTNMETNKR
jgi:hypothetical protein